MYKDKRFLGNTNEMEVHDTTNEQRNCQLDEIKAEHRRWYDYLSDAKHAGFDNCRWCLGGSRR